MAGQDKTFRVARKDQVWHLVQRGIITQLHFDFEAYGLNTRFAQIMAYGDALGDIAGNYLGSEEIHVKRPERYLPNPAALAVTRTSFAELEKEDRLDHRSAMAKIAHRFENVPGGAAAAGIEEKGSRGIHTVRKIGKDLYKKEHAWETVHIPLFDPQGRMELDKDGNIATDPPGLLSLGEKGEILIGPDKQLVTIPVKKEGRGASGSINDVYEYRPMTLEDGAIRFDVRYHPDKGYLAYRFDETPDSPYYENIENGYYEDDRDHSKWKTTKPRLLVNGYRIKWYDIAVLRTNLVRAGFHPSNIFFTGSKATISDKELPKNFSVDTYSAAMNTHLLGPQGEEGLKLSDRIDPRTGEEVPSAKLELLMAENDRYANTQRQLRSGVRMPDGARYDARKGHKSPAYDSQACFALYNYCRQLSPDTIRSLELQADEDSLRELLPGMDLTNPKPPIFTAMRNIYPNKPTLDAMGFVAFDDQQGHLKRIISVRLNDIDIEKFRYKGRTLLELAQEDLARGDSSPESSHFVRILKEMNHKPDGVFRVDSIRKFHGAFDYEQAQHSKAAQNWDRELIDANYRYLFLENQDILSALCNAVSVLNWEMRQAPPPPNPFMEEQWTYNGFGDLDYLESEARNEFIRQKNIPGKGQVRGICQTLHEVAMSAFKHHNTVDELLHRLAIQAHPVDMLSDDDIAEENDTAQQAIANYQTLFKKVRERLRKMDSPYVQVFDEFINSAGKLAPPSRWDKIQSFRWDLMTRILNDDERERRDRRSQYSNGWFESSYARKGRLLCANCSRDFRVVDEKGREIAIDRIIDQYAHLPHDVVTRFEKQEWRIQFKRLSSEPSTTAILFQHADTGRLADLPTIWQHRYKALELLYLNGPPNEDASNMRLSAIPVIERELAAMEINQAAGEDGGLARVFSRFVSGEAEMFLRSEEGQRFIAEYRESLEEIKKKSAMTGADLQTVRYHSESGLPYDWIEHEIDPAQCITINVPDAHLRDPLYDSRQSPCSLVIGALKDAEMSHIRKGRPVILRGMQTGRLYYPGPASIRKAPGENGSYSDYFEQARRAYEDEAGLKFPPADKRRILLIQELFPVANTRKISAALQTLKVPASHFDGLVAPRLANFDDKAPLTGLVLPADYCPQELRKGERIRLRETLMPIGAKIEGTEGHETGHVYETTLKNIRRITLGQLRKEVESGKMTDKKARQYGYASSYDMWEKINEAVISRESADPDSEALLLLDFKKVDKRSWAYFNPAAVPRAAFSRDGKPVPPSAYRAFNDNAPGGKPEDEEQSTATANNKKPQQRTPDQP